jgi:hypothetical protein
MINNIHTLTPYISEIHINIISTCILNSLELPSFFAVSDKNFVSISFLSCVLYVIFYDMKKYIICPDYNIVIRNKWILRTMR